MKKSNFLQVGRMIECGHCNPKFAEGMKKAEKLGFKCKCVCHEIKPVEELSESDCFPGPILRKLNQVIRRLNSLTNDP